MSRDRPYLDYIDQSIASVEELTSGGREIFLAAKHDQAATLYYLQTLAEATQRISDALKSAHPEVDWAAIGGFRNRLAHGYLDVDLDIIWNVIKNYLPPLKTAVQAMLQSLDGETGANNP